MEAVGLIEVAAVSATIGLLIGLMFRAPAILAASMAVLIMAMGLGATRYLPWGVTMSGLVVTLVALQLGYIAGVAVRAAVQK